MVVGYIKDKKLKQFKGIEIDFFDNNYIIALDSNKKNKDKIKKKLIKYVQKFKIDTLVFSKELEDFKLSILEMLVANNVLVLNGKNLMEFMEFEVVKYIINKQKVDMKGEEIYIVFKKTDTLDLNFLKKFIEGFRIVNIITNDVDRLKNVQNNLFDNEGILISVSNNKKKALKRAKYVLNINLNKKELEKYRINRNAIIINIREVVKYDTCGFEGINVNQIKIKCPDELLEKFEQIGDKFDLVELYESLLFSDNMQKRKIEDVYDRIEKDDIRIMEVIGNNGPISNAELEANRLETQFTSSQKLNAIL